MGDPPGFALDRVGHARRGHGHVENMVGVRVPDGAEIGHGAVAVRAATTDTSRSKSMNASSTASPPPTECQARCGVGRRGRACTAPCRRSPNRPSSARPDSPASRWRPAIRRSERTATNGTTGKPCSREKVLFAQAVLRHVQDRAAWPDWHDLGRCAGRLAGMFSNSNVTRSTRRAKSRIASRSS